MHLLSSLKKVTTLLFAITLVCIPATAAQGRDQGVQFGTPSYDLFPGVFDGQTNTWLKSDELQYSIILQTDEQFRRRSATRVDYYIGMDGVARFRLRESCPSRRDLRFAVIDVGRPNTAFIKECEGSRINNAQRVWINTFDRIAYEFWEDNMPDEVIGAVIQTVGPMSQ